MLGLLAAKRLDRWTELFLATTVATNVTGFLFPYWISDQVSDCSRVKLDFNTDCAGEVEFQGKERSLAVKRQSRNAAQGC